MSTRETADNMELVTETAEMVVEMMEPFHSMVAGHLAASAPSVLSELVLTALMKQADATN
jgi:hypothetical protein